MPDPKKVIQALENCVCYPKRCQNCPWDVDGEKCSESFSKSLEYPPGLVEDALALLEEQEPRVMTLEEVRGDHDRVLWIECDDSKTQSIGQYRGHVCWHDGHIGKWERFVTMGFANDYLHRETEKYGKTWRCWNARPTEEQMRETPWEEVHRET